MMPQAEDPRGVGSVLTRLQAVPGSLVLPEQRQAVSRPVASRCVRGCLKLCLLCVPQLGP
jgi:hypothetical protein